MKENIYKAINEKTFTETLSNGLKICVIPKPGFNKSYAMLSVKYGSIDARFEVEGKLFEPPKGVAHFLEHKVFEQPDGGNALQIFASTGASPNAFTSRNITAYHFSCTEHFKRNLEILLNFVSTPYFTDENVKKEQGIIAQEIGMVNDNPYHCVMDNLMNGLYVNHPAKDSIIGTIESINNITRETLFKCYSTFYVPSNMVLTVIGDVDFREVCDTAEAMLKKEYVSLPERFYGKEPDEVSTEYVEKRMEVNLPVFALGFKDNEESVGSDGIRNRLKAELAMDILAGTSSTLYAKLYRDGLINKQFGAGAMFFPGNMCGIVTGESRDPEKVRKELLSAANKLIKAREPDNFGRIKRASYGVNVRSLDRFETLCREQTEGIMNGYDFLDALSDYEKIEWKEVQKAICDIIDENKMAMSVILPK